MTETPKKIVSKREYAKALSTRAGISLLSVLGSSGAFLAGCIAIKAFIGIIWGLTAETTEERVATVWRCSLAMGGSIAVAYICAKVGAAATDRADSMDEVVPLTRTNTADLPVQESLVRASEPPQVPQQSILLRPAMETDETPTEQLLRPS